MYADREFVTQYIDVYFCVFLVGDDLGFESSYIQTVSFGKLCVGVLFCVFIDRRTQTAKLECWHTIHDFVSSLIDALRPRN